MMLYLSFTFAPADSLARYPIRTAAWGFFRFPIGRQVLGGTYQTVRFQSSMVKRRLLG